VAVGGGQCCETLRYGDHHIVINRGAKKCHVVHLREIGCHKEGELHPGEAAEAGTVIFHIGKPAGGQKIDRRGAKGRGQVLNGIP